MEKHLQSMRQRVREVRKILPICLLICLYLRMPRHHSITLVARKGQKKGGKKGKNNLRVRGCVRVKIEFRGRNGSEVIRVVAGAKADNVR